MFRRQKDRLMRFVKFRLPAGLEHRYANAAPLNTENKTMIVATLAFVLAGAVAIPQIVQAQAVGSEFLTQRSIDPNEQLLLESDELIYDDQRQTVTASGNVQIAYGDYTLVADRVTYDRQTGRVVAQGNVEIIEPNGNKVYAQEIDVTDNFQDGFVSALRIETPDNTRFAAESAERRDGEVVTLVNGVYTACEPCRDRPEKPPLWQIRANRVIINNRTKVVAYEGATFELFGKPIAYLANFSHPDPSIKRLSGFLMPEIGYDSELGYHIKNSYFWALAPNFDVTASGTYYHRQGFLGEAEWRHRTELGEYNLHIAKIDQNGKDEFAANTIDSVEDGRFAVSSKGKFEINPRWAFGWNAIYQSDDNFAATYLLEGFEAREVTNDVYLTGLNGKNYFDLRAQQFLIQDNRLNQVPDTYSPGFDRLQDQQAHVLPSFDYNVVSDDEAGYGQLALNLNVTNIDRSKPDIKEYDGVPSLAANERHYGITGNHTRASGEIEWKKSTIVQGGALVIASLSARGDGFWQNLDTPGTAFNPLITNDSIFRTMPAAMLEIRYPMIANDSMASHIFEPIAQIIVRPNETHIGEMPNEDAQSLVFGTSNLFERDKFSGFDRVEGGTRANIGFRYSASFNNGASLSVVAGQSFQLAGLNSFAERDLVNAGLESGLETKHSDYVASVDLNTGTGLSVGASGRFDNENASLRRGEVGARYFDTNFGLAGSYIFIDAQPNYGFVDDRHETTGSASVSLNDNWKLFGAASYDLQNNALFSRSIGASYDDSCFSFSVAYSQIDNRYGFESNTRSINFKLGLRTIGESEYSYKLDNTQQN